MLPLCKPVFVKGFVDYNTLAKFLRFKEKSGILLGGCLMLTLDYSNAAYRLALCYKFGVISIMVSSSIILKIGVPYIMVSFSIIR